ncbi:MAG: DUF3352 domain-containing protein [Actinomycetota bacterium]|nr:DUF3352 domain-containing protein [Actinomycetota bacterium]
MALVAAGCGGGGNENADPASVAPKGAPIYFSAFVRPQGSQKAAVEAIARKVAGVSNPGAQLESLLERSSRNSKSKVSYKDDVKPWLGRRAAFVASAFGPGGNSAGAAIVAAKDTGKAQDFVDKLAKDENAKKRSYKGVEYQYASAGKSAMGVVGDFLVAGNEPEVKRIIDASKGGSLKDDTVYSKVAGHAAGKLAFGFLDVRGLVDALGAAGRIPAGQGSTVQSLLNSNQPVTLAVSARPNQVTMEVTGPAAKSVSSARQTSVIGALPGDAWAAFGIGDVGGAIKRAIAQFSAGGIGGGVVQTLVGQLRASTGLDLNRDIIAALGDVGFFASGTNLLQVGGGAVVTSPDPSAARRLADKLGALIARQGAPNGVRVSATNVAGAQGVRITSPRLPGGVNLVVKGKKLVAAYGTAATRAALSGGRTLANNPAFQAASASLGGGATPSLYVTFGPIAQLVGAAGGANAASAQRVLNALQSLVAGGTQQGGNAVGKIVVNLK